MVWGAIIDIVKRKHFMEKKNENESLEFFKDLNLETKDLAILLEVLSFTKRNGCVDSFRNAIREIKSDSSYFAKFMKREVINKKYGEDFEFAKLMVTKINPNTILGFKLSMLLPKRELRESNPKLFNKILEQRNFFVNYFENECDLSLEAFPSAKVNSICEMGFMTTKEIAIIREKRSKEVNKYATKNDYNRGTYTLEKY